MASRSSAEQAGHASFDGRANARDGKSRSKLRSNATNAKATELRSDANGNDANERTQKESKEEKNKKRKENPTSNLAGGAKKRPRT